MSAIVGRCFLCRVEFALFCWLYGTDKLLGDLRGRSEVRTGGQLGPPFGIPRVTGEGGTRDGESQSSSSSLIRSTISSSMNLISSNEGFVETKTTQLRGTTRSDRFLKWCNELHSFFLEMQDTHSEALTNDLFKIYLKSYWQVTTKKIEFKTYFQQRQNKHPGIFGNLLKDRN
jgi:hypothetical protein